MIFKYDIYLKSCFYSASLIGCLFMLRTDIKSLSPIKAGIKLSFRNVVGVSYHTAQCII